MSDDIEGADKPSPRKRRAAPEHVYSGEPVSMGIAIGPAYMARDVPVPVMERRESALEPAAELERLGRAIERSLRQLEKLRDRLALLPEESQGEIDPMLDAYVRMLGPSRLRRGIRNRISASGLTAEAAVLDETESLAQAITSMRGQGAEENADLARRAGEFREIGRRLIRNLTGAQFRTFGGLPDGSVLVAEQLRPADAALIDPSRVCAVVTAEGGTTDHTAIMLRALGIPSVLAATGVTSTLQDGAMMVVDGALGRVVVNPSPQTLCEAQDGVADYARERQKLGRLRRLASRLTSGEKIQLQANLEIPAELPLIAQSGAAGIGLLRTEFLFINRDTIPQEDEQTAIYSSIIEAMGGDVTTIRVVDWGGEKQSDALAQSGFATEGGMLNPALGLRGLRLLLKYPDILETQLAAILRASVAGPVRVLLPMVTFAPEIVEAREIYERVARRLRRRGIRLGDTLPPLGIMVETPAAALMADALAQHSEFLAIGTNDLTMYTLAVDRASAEVAGLYSPLHPSVLRLITTTAKAALRQHRPVSVCGEIAGDPMVVPLLVGMGVRSFSMSASAVPRVKQAIRARSMEDCERLRRSVMEETDSAAVLSLIRATST